MRPIVQWKRRIQQAPIARPKDIRAGGLAETMAAVQFNDEQDRRGYRRAGRIAKRPAEAIGRRSYLVKSGIAQSAALEPRAKRFRAGRQAGRNLLIPKLRRHLADVLAQYGLPPRDRPAMIVYLDGNDVPGQDDLHGKTGS